MPAFPKPVGRDRDSPWRDCKKCHKPFMKSRLSSTLCKDCFFEKSNAKKAARIDRRKRAGAYPKPESRWWKEQAGQNRLVKDVELKCEVCGLPEKECKRLYTRGLTREHLMPVRFITEHHLGDPHLDINIKLTCSGCCGKKAAAEVKLFNGDVLGFITDLKKWGWDMEEYRGVLLHYRMWSSNFERIIA